MLMTMRTTTTTRCRCARLLVDPPPKIHCCRWPPSSLSSSSSLPVGGKSSAAAASGCCQNERSNISSPLIVSLALLFVFSHPMATCCWLPLLVAQQATSNQQQAKEHTENHHKVAPLVDCLDCHVISLSKLQLPERHLLIGPNCRLLACDQNKFARGQLERRRWRRQKKSPK